MLGREFHDLPVKFQRGGLCRGVGGKTNHDGDRTRDRMPRCMLESAQIVFRRRRVDMPYRATGNEKAESMDRVGGRGRQDHIARCGDRLGQVGKAFLGAQRDDDFAVRIKIDIEAALVIARLGLAQSGNAARGGIAVGAWIFGRLAQFCEDVRRCRQVRIAHAEIDDVRAICPQFGLQAIDFFENIRRQALGAVKFHR